MLGIPAFPGLIVLLVGALGCLPVIASPDTDRETVALLDRQFQAAVKAHDADTMDRILHRDMMLVLGDGRINTRDEQLREARDKAFSYEVQDEDPGTQVVRVSGDTAVVTARLWIKGTHAGVPFDYRLWFTDTYVRTPEGWRYFFGQASLRLPDDSRRLDRSIGSEPPRSG